MQAARDLLKKNGWLGWTLALGLLGLSVYLLISRSRSSDTYSVDRLTEMVTIKFTDTGEELQVPRGRLESWLRDREGKIDPAVGITNPKTNQPTGFLYNKSEWESTVGRLNQEKLDAAKGASPTPSAPAPKN